MSLSPPRWMTPIPSGSARRSFGACESHGHFGGRARYPLEPIHFGGRGVLASASARRELRLLAHREEALWLRPVGGFHPSPLFFGREAARATGQVGDPRTDGNDRKAEGCSDAETAADEGNSSKGVTASRGTEGRVPGHREVTGLRRETRRTPQAGSGAQQTRGADAEQTVEVVRNHEGGTGFDGSHRRTEGSASFREWTHRKTNGRGEQSGRIPREEELGPLRRLRGVLAETRAL